MPKQCICQICNCGRHRCPHRPYIKGGSGPCTISEYTEKYPKHPLQATDSCKPKQEAYQSSGPIEDKTTNRIDYIKHPTEKPYAHKPDVYKKPEGDIDHSTHYKRDFTNKPIQPAKTLKPDMAKKVSAPFDGQPTYSHDYRKWEMPPVDRFGSKDQWAPPTQPFEGDTHYRRDFKPKPGGPSASCKPLETVKPTDTQFEDLTTNRQDFKQHPVPPREVREKKPYKANKAPFEGVSTQKRDYTEKQGGPSNSFKPTAAAYRSEAPFDDVTTFKTDFVKWPSERPYHHDPDTYKKPEGEMDLGTHYSRDFTQKPIAPAKTLKPANVRGRQAQFEGEPTYKSDYRQWELGQREKAGPKTGYVPSGQPFEGTSNYSSDFRKHPINPVAAIKPGGGAYTSNAPFEDGTMYRTDYTRKAQDPCPASLLDTGASRYVFRLQDQQGHKFYRPVEESITPLQTKPNTPPRIPAAAVA